MNHPKIEQLERYLSNSTNIFMRNHIKKHIAKCAECSDKLEELKEVEKLATDLKESLKTFPIEYETHIDQTFLRIGEILGTSEKEASA